MVVPERLMRLSALPSSVKSDGAVSRSLMSRIDAGETLSR